MIKKSILLILLISTLGLTQNPVYVPIGNTRQLQALNTIIATSNVILGEVDQAKYTTTYNTCLNPPAPAPTGNALICATTAQNAANDDVTARYVTAIKALYAMNPTQADSILLVNKLYIITKP